MAVIRQLALNELKPYLLKNFTRYQLVELRWRLVDGEWQLEPCSFADDWDGVEKAAKIKLLRETLRMGSTVWGAFAASRLVGFANLESAYFGSQKQYLLLHLLHIDAYWRRQGIGRKLFKAACAEASARGAQKLYISASSAADTQAFYLKMGCRDALEINAALAEREPFDRQMEYVLRQ